MNLIEPELRALYQSQTREEFSRYIHLCFVDLHPNDIATVLVGMQEELVTAVLDAIDLDRQVEIFYHLPDGLKKDIFMNFSFESQVEFIRLMLSDERIDLLKTVPKSLYSLIFEQLSDQDRQDISALINYPEDIVGSLMSSEYMFLLASMTVSQSLVKIRQEALGKETIYYLYVVDQNRHLIGFVSLRDLIVSDDKVLIQSVMKTDVLRVRDTDEQCKVSQLISDYDLLAVPVVTVQGKLVGIVTVDDVVDVLIDEDTEDILAMAAAGKPMDYFSSSIWMIYRERVVWLFVLVWVGFLSGLVLKNFESTLDKFLPLIYFLPLMCSAGGNAGTQSSTVIIRGMAVNEIRIEDIYRVFKKEFFVGILLGCSIGFLSCLRSLTLNSSLKLAFVITLSTTLTLILSTSIGCLLPLFCKKMKLDPALMSAPLIASLVDVFCIFLYFSVASVLL